MANSAEGGGLEGGGGECVNLLPQGSLLRNSAFLFYVYHNFFIIKMLLFPFFNVKESVLHIFQ